MNLEEAQNQPTEVYCPDCLRECEYEGFLHYIVCPECDEVIALTKAGMEQAKTDRET